jgi:hypothetical protein
VAALVLFAFPATAQAAEGNDAQERLDIIESAKPEHPGEGSAGLRKTPRDDHHPHMLKGASQGASRGKGCGALQGRLSNPL